MRGPARHRRAGPSYGARELERRDSRPSGPAEHGLQLEELLEAGLSPLAAVARLLVAAEAGGEVRTGAIDVDVAGADLPGDLAGALGVAGRDVSREAVQRVVGDLDRLRVALVGQDGEDRPEDLLARDRHVVADVAEHGRLDEVAALEAGRTSRTAGRQLRALVDAGLDQALDLVELRLADHRPEHRAVAERVAYAHRLGGGARDLQRRVVLLLRHQHAGRGVAGLAAVQEAGAYAAAHRRLEIDVVEQDVGRLAAQLLRDALHARRRRDGDRDTATRRAGERHQVHLRVRRERLADRRSVAVHQVEDTRRHAGLVEDLREDDRVERRDLARLQHHRATGCESGEHLAGDL